MLPVLSAAIFLLVLRRLPAFRPSYNSGDMISDRQIEANRRNAKLSTGLRTKQGKAASSRNALRHGLSRRDGGEAAAIAVTRHRCGGAAELRANEQMLARIRAYHCALLVQIMRMPRPELLSD